MGATYGLTSLSQRRFSSKLGERPLVAWERATKNSSADGPFVVSSTTSSLPAQAVASSAARRTRQAFI